MLDARPPSGPESGAGAEEGSTSIERWKREAAFYEAELARRSQIWEEREQSLISEIDMRDAELNALEHRVRKAASDMEASEAARSEAVSKAQQLAARAEELEHCVSDALYNSEYQQVSTKLSADSNENDKLRARAHRAEEHVMRLGEMLAEVCRQESQLVALLTSAREQLRQLGCADVADKSIQKQASTGKIKTAQPPKQPLATNNTGVTDESYRVAKQQQELNLEAKQQVKSCLMAREHLKFAAKEAESLENEIRKLQGARQKRRSRLEQGWDRADAH